MTTTVQPIDDEFFAPEVLADPYPFFNRLREQEPVHWNAQYEFWAVTGYDEVAWVYRHPEFARSGTPDDFGVPLDGENRRLYESVVRPFFGDKMIAQNAPIHLARRKIVQRLFTPTAMEAWRPLVRKVVNELLDEIEPGRIADLREKVALPLPLFIIGELMGIPASDRQTVHELTDKIFAVSGSDPNLELAAEGVSQFSEFLQPLIEEREKNPTDDYISLLVAGHLEGKCTAREVAANAVLLLSAGHETSMNLLCNGTVAILQYPEAWKKLRQDPEGLARAATEECLRWNPSLMVSFRKAGPEPFELAGKTIKPGQKIHLLNQAANRDPRHFDAPDTFMIDRQPNLHMAFGSGHHYCLGAPLGRIEAQEFFHALGTRFVGAELVSDPPEYDPSYMTRSPKKVDIAWGVS